MATTLPSDFSEFLKLLNKNSVRYLLVGGHAVAYHGHVRGTADMDIWVDRGGDNSVRIVAALAEFGFRGPNVSARQFEEPDRIIRLGVPPVRIELLTSISGVAFEECYSSRDVAQWDDVTVDVISREMLQRNKRASGRPRDLDDIENLAKSKPKS